MRRSTRHLWQHIGLSLLGWIAAAMLFSLVRLYGVEEEGLYLLAKTEHSIASLILAQGLTAGVLFGLLFGAFNLLLDRINNRHTSYWMLILLRTLGHVLLASLVVVCSLWVTQWMESPETEFNWAWWQSHPFFKTALVVLIYTGVISVLFNLLRQINDLIGPGILFNLIAGKYHQPQEEERIFMFLDLKSSTTYAERLGHVLYSELIQDCFMDLTEAIRKHDVEIYQYVGDEAVLTWRPADGLRKNNCLEAYFTFEATIQRRAKYYFNKYDLVPAFKAGVNIGLVMVAEVGIVKKEIAYHSDVLSTAARIQGQCNRLGQRLLISGTLHDTLTDLTSYHVAEEGRFRLRGKEQEIILYSINPKEKIEHQYEFSE